MLDQRKQRQLPWFGADASEASARAECFIDLEEKPGLNQPAGSSFCLPGLKSFCVTQRHRGLRLPKIKTNMLTETEGGKSCCRSG